MVPVHHGLELVRSPQSTHMRGGRQDNGALLAVHTQNAPQAAAKIKDTEPTGPAKSARPSSRPTGQTIAGLAPLAALHRKLSELISALFRRLNLNWLAQKAKVATPNTPKIPAAPYTLESTPLPLAAVVPAMAVARSGDVEKGIRGKNRDFDEHGDKNGEDSEDDNDDGEGDAGPVPFDVVV